MPGQVVVRERRVADVGRDEDLARRARPGRTTLAVVSEPGSSVRRCRPRTRRRRAPRASSGKAEPPRHASSTTCGTGSSRAVRQRVQVRRQLARGACAVDRLAVADDVEVGLAEVDDAMPVGVCDVCVVEVPLGGTIQSRTSVPVGTSCISRGCARRSRERARTPSPVMLRQSGKSSVISASIRAPAPSLTRPTSKSMKPRSRSLITMTSPGHSMPNAGSSKRSAPESDT